MKERNYSFDIMRVIACIMIICMHAPMPSENAIGIFNVSVSYFTEPGLCLFFVISGALLLPVKVGTKDFLKRRLSKVLLPTLVFTSVYLLIRFINGETIDWMQSVCSIPFSAQGHGVLWFMYTLIGLYLVSPIVSRWLSSVSKREEEFYLCLWCVTLCYPVVRGCLSINNSETGVLYYFGGFLGYFILGHYLKNYADELTWKHLSIPVLVAVLAPVVTKLMHIEVDVSTMFGYLSVFIAILCVAYYKVGYAIGKKLNGGGKLTNLIVLTSNLSFGIYLIHIAVMRFFLWKQEWIINIHNYILQWVVVVTLTFVLSWMISCAISLLPFGDYIIGFKRNKK